MRKELKTEDELKKHEVSIILIGNVTLLAHYQYNDWRNAFLYRDSNVFVGFSCGVPRPELDFGLMRLCCDVVGVS